MQRSFLTIAVLFSAGLMSIFAQLKLPPRAASNPNPWNGSWQLDVKRSSPVAAEPGVPQIYRFHLGPGDSPDIPITWEIPELGEVVQGRTDGHPMPILRTKPAPGLRLAVRRDGQTCLLYSVYKNERLEAGGRMMLIDNGTAWIDLTWPEDRQDLASELVYMKR